MSIDRWTYWENVVHIYNGISLNHKKDKLMPFAAMWMDLETLILSEVSQKENTNTIWYHLFMESKIWNRWSYLKITNKQKRIMAKKSRLGVSKGERGGHLGDFFLDANCYIWNGWAVWSYWSTQRNECDWVTWLYNRSWWNTVNQLYCNNNNNNKEKKKEEFWQGSSHCSSEVTNLISIHENEGLIPCFTLWVKDAALPRAVV